MEPGAPVYWIINDRYGASFPRGGEHRATKRRPDRLDTRSGPGAAGTVIGAKSASSPAVRPPAGGAS